MESLPEQLAEVLRRGLDNTGKRRTESLADSIQQLPYLLFANPFPTKLVPKDLVNYGPAEDKDKCGACKHFIPRDSGDDTCERVSGDIHEEDTCDLFSPRMIKVIMGMG